MARYNPELYKLAMSGLQKAAFTPPSDPSQGGAPPMDPSMMGGMPPGAGGMPPADPSAAAAAPPPMDPSMMGMPPGGAPPMDPAMLGALMGGGGGAPELAPDGLPLPPESGEEAPTDDVKKQIKDVLTETGVIKPPKMKPEEQFNYVIQLLTAICKQVGAEVPEIPQPGEGDQKKGDGSKGVMSNGSTGSTSSQSLSSGSSKSASAKLSETLRRLRGQ